MSKKIHINEHLFEETSHSPSLVDIVGEAMLSEVVDYCFIANPYYPDEKLIKLMQEQLPTLIKFYPSSNTRVAQQNLSEVLYVKPENLILGNGATELITLILEHLVDDLAVPIPTFSEYIEKIRRKDCVKTYQLPATNDYKLNLDDYADWILHQAISAALIINPGNPTGQLLTLDEMFLFIEKMKHLKMILVDEAFIDFADKDVPSLLPYVKNYPNLVLIRSMSKHCGIPGLRLGYCCTSNEQFLSSMRELLPVWNLNTIAEFFLAQLKRTNNDYHEARLRVIEDISHLYHELKSIKGFYVYPTGSNFVLIKSQIKLDGKQLQRTLLEDYHCYVRDCSNKIGIDKFHIRVASQGREKDKRIIDALKELSMDYFSDKK